MSAGGTIAVVEPGLQTTVQDYPGRLGLWRVGIPPSGPMDSLAFRLANRLVGNPPGTAALEVQFTGPKLVFDTATAVALTGPESEATLDGEPVPFWQTLKVRAGGVLHCPYVQRGARIYITAAGGIEREPAFGSRATFPQSGIGGGALKPGDVLCIGKSSGDAAMRCVPADRRPDYPDTIQVEVTSGPHFDWLSDAGHVTLLTTAWKVTGRSDRTGIRLDGPRLDFAARALHKPPEHGPEPTNVINTGYPVGGLNLCGDTPIILPVDGPSMGGFITPIVVASAALRKVGQARPGQFLRFRLVPVADAIALRRQLELLASELSVVPLAAAGAPSC
ncbi:MAG: biotin-dependent carboxyltransferase [Alphaproteobacteria bacterium]|nr:biotin-dependent carboxyltransferase [Alphaproteobacteria bacterium]